MSSTKSVKGHSNLESALTIVRTSIAELGQYDGAEAVLGKGENLAIIGRAIFDLTVANNLQFQAIGARGIYGEAVARAAMLAGDSSWFSVRQKLKGRGTNSWTEGVRDLRNKDVIIVDAFGQADTLLVSELVGRVVGANVVGILPVVDFDEGIGENAAALLPGIPYIPLIPKDMLAVA